MKHIKVVIGILTVVIVMTLVGFFVLNREAAAPKEPVSTQKFSAPDIQPIQTNRVAVQGNQLMPQAITIARGTSVIWNNDDSISQEIIFHFGEGEEASGALGPGANYSRSFDKARTVLYTLRSNPNEVGVIKISP